MSQNSCCIPGCAVVRKDGVSLHRFPNPETSGEKFTTWILNIGGEIALLDRQDIYDNRRVCHRQFKDLHKYPSGRLSKLAIPTIHIPDLQAQSLGEAMVLSKFDTSQRSCLEKCGFNTSGIFFAQAENICIEILKEHCTKKNISVYIKLIINLNVSVSFISCTDHADNLRNHLINKSTMFFINNWCKDVNNILTGKITFWDVNDPMKERANRHYLNHKGRKRRTQNFIVNV